ncbi:protein DBF4 homolog A [Microcaecilia unicolor]|uniref:Protein DBF4 homolog A n=1 Tax=Microcaecilia unicolor TaxID=1415580 RepID=A0A6P7XYP0_9AMPH|nr:protein DBF4 homolog A [Microcaecilia unicolor]
MRPSCSNLGIKTQLNCSIQGNASKKRSSLKTGKKAAEKSEQDNSKTFTGKVFYLDLPSNAVSENLERDIKDLGGTVEGFLSKDISCLISNKKEAKYAQSLRQLSPVPSPESVQNNRNDLPHLNSRRDSYEGSSYKKSTEAICISRGKSLVEKVIKEQEIIQSNSVLSNALSWGVKIVHIDDIRYYIEKKKEQLLKTDTSVKDTSQGYGTWKSNWKLKKPFIKVEDRSRHYRPFYLQLYSFPVLNYPVLQPCSPFDMIKKISGGPRQSMPRNKTDNKHDSEGQIQLNLKEKKRRGYCECCLKKYEDLQNHLASEQHRNFAESIQYQVVDNIISTFVYDFVECGQDTSEQKRTKCSIGATVPIVIEKNVKLEERLKKAKMFQCWYFCKNSLSKTTQKINSNTQSTERLASSLQYPASIPDPVCLSPCHTSYTSELMNKLENKTDRSYTAAVNEVNTVSNALILPSHKHNKECTLKIPTVSVHSNDSKLKGEININAIDIGFQDLQAEIHRCYSRTNAQNSFSGTERIAQHLVERDSQKKRKLDCLFPCPAKYLKTSTCDSALSTVSFDFDTNNSLQKGHCNIHENGQQLHHSVPEIQNSTSVDNNTDGCPSVKLHRKVKLGSGRSRRGSQKQNMTFCSNQNDELLAEQESKQVLQSPNKVLLELFQTSGSLSDFEGFTSNCDQEGPSFEEYCWEEEPSTSRLWTLFARTSSDASSFLGF